MADTPHKTIDIRRDGLLRRIVMAAEPIVVLDAVAGMGKSTLLSQLASHLQCRIWRSARSPGEDDFCDGVLLWDLPPDTLEAEIPAIWRDEGRRVVIAKRPYTRLRGLDRAIAYGKALFLGAQDLCFSRGELEATCGRAAVGPLLAETGGWPFLVGLFSRASREEAAVTRFLADDVLSETAEFELVQLRLAQQAAKPAAKAKEAVQAYLQASGIAGPLATAVDMVLAERLEDSTRVPAISTAYAAHGMQTEAIAVLQRAGLHELAVRAFIANFGRYYIFFHGSEAFDRVLAGFPAELAAQNEGIVTALAMQALKRGEVLRAQRLLADCYGSRANNVLKVLSDRAAFSAAFRSFRLVMLIYEDVVLGDDLLEQATTLLSEFPLDADLERGSIYNSILEFYIRRRRFAVAQDIADRALFHYERAGVPLLCFYINLHQAMMHLMSGDAVRARRNAVDAAEQLSRVPFESPMDARLLALLQACVEYEDGKPEPLARFLTSEMDDFSHGEIWPSLIEFALQYGSQALSEHFSMIAARGFLDRWRAYQVYNRQFRLMIEVRDAVILQNGNRWQEAAEKLAAVQARINRTWVEAAVDELTRLQDRDEIALAVVWLRHIVFEMPGRVHLDRQLTALASNLNLTGRQRLCIEVWQAYVARRRHNLTSARAILQKTFENAARLGTIAPLSEERQFLRELTGDRRISDFLQTTPTSQQILRRLRDTGLPNTPLGEKNGLTRRETRLLLMIAEGASNKFIAHALGLSEATVKFHLGNLYRKLGCSRRREAIIAAKALGVIS
ncbi:Transcriptional regulatory protein DegU [Ensifer adhaerens]|uniref:helix-turn-helix transcriptional regulator n=1 Tax=Ensifer adhaerens TaxID=106592 RepID=UPI001F461B4A|nr:LuxR C-terminal-related transcriptional regulator [Ensifer adhaerens]NRP22286.1 Transcriptional regulatory protein DegU [Ensifer adhaerens]